MEEDILSGALMEQIASSKRVVADLVVPALIVGTVIARRSAVDVQSKLSQLRLCKEQ